MTSDRERRLQEIRERVEAATAGPWIFEPERYSAKCVIGIKPRDDRWIASAQPEFNGWDNGQFIAASREDVPFLLEEIERLRKSEDHTHDWYERRWKALKDLLRGTEFEERGATSWLTGKSDQMQDRESRLKEIRESIIDYGTNPRALLPMFGMRDAEMMLEEIDRLRELVREVVDADASFVTKSETCDFVEAWCKRARAALPEVSE